MLIAAVATANKVTFHADFYEATATVFPLLWIALMFPGGLVRRSVVRARKRRDAAAALHPRGDWSYGTYQIGIFLLLVFFFMGEVISLAVLDQGSANSGDHTMVFLSVFVLLGATSWNALVYVFDGEDPNYAVFNGTARRTEPKIEPSRDSESTP